MRKFKKYIAKGISESLEKVPSHGKAPFKRLVMLNNNLIANTKTFISVHLIKSLPKTFPSYSKLHKHKYNEINLIISVNSKLVYKIGLEDEIYKVASPATIFITKGIRHRAEVISGEGIFVVIKEK
jgi:hypothetical protein